jgi:hypothetical protein
VCDTQIFENVFSLFVSEISHTGRWFSQKETGTFPPCPKEEYGKTPVT